MRTPQTAPGSPRGSPEIGPYLAESERVIRPANVSAGSPGRGLTVAPAADGTPVAVINLLGRLFIDPAVGPFEVVDELVDEARKRAQVVVVDFHAEATSEKVALPRPASCPAARPRSATPA